MKTALRLIKIVISLIFLGFWLGMGMPEHAWGQDNPFELIPRIERKEAPEPVAVDSQATGNPFEVVQEAPPPATVDSQDAGNPFNLIREAPTTREKRVAPVESVPVRPEAPNRYRRLKLFVIFGILLLLAVFLTLRRSLFRKSFQAFLNDTAMNQLYRDQQGRGIYPFLLLYAMFFINAGIFIFFILKYFDLPKQPVGDWSLLLFCILGVAGVFFFKHLLLGYLSFTFPVEKEVSRYHFIIIVFSIVIGLFLVPVNTLMGYAAESLKPWVLYGSLGVIVLVYLFRYLRSLIIANNFFVFHKFHFLLYICTVEIAPVLFLFKLITRQL